MKKILLMAALSAFFVQCTNDPSPTGKATLKVNITDAPGDYEKIILHMEEMRVRSGGQWDTLKLVKVDTFDILDYANGKSLFLAQGPINAGVTDELRLVLADTNILVLKDGTQHFLKTPSAYSSGVKVKFETAKNVQPGQVHYAVLDFDANRSIVKKGNGTYGFKPVIRGFWDQGNGEAEGFTFSTNHQVSVSAIYRNDTLTSTIADSTGYFKLVGLPPSTYSFYFESTNGKDSTLTNISIQQNTTTPLDTVLLN